MIKKYIKKENGFTLVETIVYATLLSVLIGMIIGVVMQILTGNREINGKVFLEEEANFVINKIRYEYSGAAFINSPAAGNSSSTLSINRLQNPGLENEVRFSFTDDKIIISRGGGATSSLVSDSIKIDNILFTHLESSTDKPPGLKIDLTLSKGESTTRTFGVTFYERQ